MHTLLKHSSFKSVIIIGLCCPENTTATGNSLVESDNFYNSETSHSIDIRF